MELGDRVRERRKELGWSIRDLAHKMGYNHHSTIARIEKGEVDVNQSRIAQLSEVLGVSISYLMGWEEEIERDPVGTAEKHMEILMDTDIAEMYDDFKMLTDHQKQIVKDLVKSLAKK